jgi:hypothetical protein
VGDTPGSGVSGGFGVPAAHCFAQGDCAVVFGEVTHAAVDSDVLDGSHLASGLLEPLARLGWMNGGTTGSVGELKRIRRDDWPGDFRQRNSSDACDKP